MNNAHDATSPILSRRCPVVFSGARSCLDSDGLIRTVRGVGYKFADEPLR
jgi:hypothetical protein